MAMAKIDHAVVTRLVETLFNATAGTGITLVHLGEPQPTGELAAWARLASIDVDETPRVTNDNAQDDAEVTITLSAVCSDTAQKANAAACARVVSAVTVAMTHKTLAEGVHTLQTFAYTAAQAPYPFEGRRGRAVSIIIRGSANRSSGASME